MDIKHQEDLINQLMELEPILFLAAVEHFCIKHPLMVLDIGDAAKRALVIAFQKAQERAADMEIVATYAISRRSAKNADKLIRNKLEMWRGQTSCNWDWFLNR